MKKIPPHSADDAAVEAGDKRRDARAAGDHQPTAETLIALAGELELFHTPAEVPYVIIDVNGHREIWSLRSTTFRSWLMGQYFALTGRGAATEALKTAIGTLEAKALFDGPRREVYTRLASCEGRIYLDLGDENWRAVEIDAAGWRFVDTPPVYFRRAPGVLALPEPVRGGSIDALRPFLNFHREGDFILIVCWLLACLRGKAPFPLLVLMGEQGSAKSTLAKILRRLIDPNDAPLRALPKNERDLFISASNSYLLAYDNLSGLQAGVSDLLCTLATGGGFSTRQLYTDEGEAIFKAARPILLNGIDDIVRRPDLADRAIFVRLEAIPEEKRRTERELWAAFDAVAPFVLGALLDGVVIGLKGEAEVCLPRLPRMADFAIWSTAVETAYWPAGSFWVAYEANRGEAVEEVVEGDLVGAAVMKLLAKRPNWAGTASDLQDVLRGLDAAATANKEWPKDARALSARLKRTATFLRKLGIEYRVQRQGHHRTRLISLQRVDVSGTPVEAQNVASAASASSAEMEKVWQDKATAEPEVRTHNAVADATQGAPPNIVGNCVRSKPLKIGDADPADDADANSKSFVTAESEPNAEWSAEI